MKFFAPVLELFKAHPTLFICATAIAFLFNWTAKSYSRLSHIPGPILSAFTNLPRFLWVLSYKAHDKHIAKHREYGPIVRFGPNMVSVGDPAEISSIYRFSRPFMKVSPHTLLIECMADYVIV